jgi:hypothetical protein
MGAPLSNGGRVKHINGSATTVVSETEKQATEPAHLTIENTDSTNNLLVSFDDGVNFFTIFPTAVLQGPFAIGQRSLKLKSSAGTVVYNILWTSVV